MALQYHIVKKKDMRKGAAPDAQLYYGQIRCNERTSYEELCEMVAAYTLATDADVTCILDGLLLLMRHHLAKGNIIQLGVLGNFRFTVGAPGVEKEEDFHPSMFRTPHIRFFPGAILRELTGRVKYRKYNFLEVEKECDQPHV